MSEEKKIHETYNYSYSDKFDFEDLENRRIYINCDIDENVIDSAVYHIFRYNRIDKDVPAENRKPIIIYINTPGGIVTDGYCLIDAIRSSITPVYTVNIGTCYSMGFLIFIAGKKRYCMQSSTFLCHDGFAGAIDSMNKLRDRVEFETGEMEVYTMNYIMEQTKITEEQYSANKRKEWYFYPEEAKKLGVTDYIVGIDCDIYEIL